MHASLLDVSLLSCMCPPVCTYWTPAGAGVGFRGHHDVVLVMPMMFSVMYFAGISDDDYKDYSLRSKAVTIMNQEFCHAQDKTEQVRYTKQATSQRHMQHVQKQSTMLVYKQCLARQLYRLGVPETKLSA